MSIFSDVTDLGKLNDVVIEKYYTLDHDLVGGVSMKKRLTLKRDAIRDGSDGFSRLFESTYYYPQWVFETLFRAAKYDALANGRLLSNKKISDLDISKLDISNMKTRFNKIIEPCARFEYKNEEYISLDYYNVSVDSIRNQISTMIYNYIVRETRNSKYFLSKPKRGQKRK